jgi:hypothetical protein
VVPLHPPAQKERHEKEEESIDGREIKSGTVTNTFILICAV